MNILLQTDFQWKETDPLSMAIAGGIFVAFILFLVIANAASSGKSGRPTSGGTTRRFSKRRFRQQARKLGLTKPQLKTLENLIKRFSVSNPMTLLSNSGLLDNLLKRAIQGIDGLGATAQQKENQKLQLYRIKQVIERNATRKTVYSGTRQLRAGLQLVITPETGGRYQSRLLTPLKGALAVAVPADQGGRQLRWKRWTKVRVFFWKSNGQGYSFVTKINGYGKIRGMDALLLNHTSAIQQAQQRKYRRRDLDRPAYFYPVRILSDGVGKGSRKRAEVESHRGTLSTILDISSGGCSIRTAHPLREGELIKVEFEADHRGPINFYGKVLHTRKSKPYGGIMHIMFTRISKQNLNNINAFVYDYSVD